MSRYSKKDLAKLNKGELLELVNRQPHVAFPQRVGSGPLEYLTVPQLRKALAGPHGYLKEAAPFDAFTTAAPDIAIHGSETQDILGTAFEDHVEEPDGSQPDDSDVAKVFIPSSVPSKPEVQAVSLAESTNDPVCTDCGESLSHLNFVRSANSDPDIAMVDMKLAESLTPEELGKTLRDPSCSIVESTSSCGSISSNRISDEDVLGSYPHDTKSDQELLEEYFKARPGLSDKLAAMLGNRRKRQSDESLVRDYRFIVALYNSLMRNSWENRTGRIASEKILKFIGTTSPSLSRARQVIKLLDIFGPGTPHADPDIVKRLASTATTNKGEDLLSFLKKSSGAAAGAAAALKGMEE